MEHSDAKSVLFLRCLRPKLDLAHKIKLLKLLLELQNEQNYKNITFKIKNVIKITEIIFKL